MTETVAGKKGLTWPAEQPLLVNHLKGDDFKTEGLRKYASYRDLGVKSATNGMVLAHVIRAAKPFNADVVSHEHIHDVDFQMVYCLKGHITLDFGDGRVHKMVPGTCWIQPPSVKHTVIDYSDDYEVLEIMLPADFDTVLTEDH